MSPGHRLPRPSKAISMGPFLSYFPYAATVTVTVIMLATPPSLIILTVALLIQILALIVIWTDRFR